MFPKDKQLSSEDLRSFISANATMADRYRESQQMYLGQHQILNQEAKQVGPDNHLVVNLAHYIVETFNGFFMGIPPKITLPVSAENKALQAWQDSNSFQDKLNEISKQSDIYGRSIAFLYQDSDGSTSVAYQSPINAFMIYDDSVAHEPLAFVRYEYAEDNSLKGELYYPNTIYQFNEQGELDDGEVNRFGAVPAVEFYDNEERKGLFDGVATLIDALDKAVSQKANQVEYFDNAYLKIIGLDLGEEPDLKGNQLIYSRDSDATNAEVDFLSKPDGDNMQENYIDRLTSLIYQISMVANLNDEAFSGNSSGVALQYKLLPMKNLAASKERKFTQALRRLYEVAFGVQTISGIKKESWQDLSFQFTRNLPINLADEANTASTLEGIVSKETQLKTLSIVDDPKAEIKQMEAEQDAKVQHAVESSPAAIDADKKPADDDDQKVTDDVETEK